MILDLWNECQDSLKKYFEFDKIFDLLLYDQNLIALKTELADLCREEYKPNYRFIFLHYDTDFYLYPNTAGILLTNLQIILRDLDIPNYFCLIVTNHNNLSQELEYLHQHFTTDPYPISTIFCQLQKCHVSPSIHPVDININDIILNYSCFNHSKRNHRHTLISMMIKDDLLKKGLVSYVT